MTVTYYRPKTLVDAFDLAQTPGSLPLAGGALTLGGVLLPYDVLIDVQDIPELRLNEQNDSGATFGSALPLQTLLDWPQLPEVLRRSLTRTLSLNLRNNISLGESLRAWRDPLLREWITALLACCAGIEYLDDHGVPQWDNTINQYVDDRLDKSFITALNFPALTEGQRFGAAYVARTPADVPIINAAALIYVDPYGYTESEFVFVSGASAEVFRQVRLTNLIPNPFDEANIASAVKMVAPQVEPVDDDLGSAEYRREMARVVVQRALMECLEQVG